MGMPEIQEAPRPSNPWVPMGATVVETGTDALGSLGNRSQGIAFMNGSWMSREVHVQFWERVGVKFPCATHLPIYAGSGIMQSIFRSASRRETLGKHLKGGRRDGGLKMDWTKPLPRAWPMCIECRLDLG